MKSNMFKTYPKLALSLLMATGIWGLSSCNDKNDDFDDKGSSSVVSLCTHTGIYGRQY